MNKRIQKGSIREDSLPQPLLEQTRAATERVLTPKSPYSAIATRKRRNPPEEEKDMAGTSKKLDSSQSYFFTISAPAKLPPDTPKSYAHQVDSEVKVQPVEAQVPEWKEFEYVQPWNAGLSKGRCGAGKRKSGCVSKHTSTQDSKYAAGSLTSFYARRSGWKQAPSGEWVKDPTAEFDSESDEETKTPKEASNSS